MYFIVIAYCHLYLYIYTFLSFKLHDNSRRFDCFYLFRGIHMYLYFLRSVYALIFFNIKEIHSC